MKVLVKYEKIVPTVSEIDLDEEKFFKDFGSVQNFIDFVKIRQSLSNHYLVKGTKEDLYKNLEKYRDINFDELNYIKENGKILKTVKGSNEDQFVDLLINDFQIEVVEFRKNVKDVKYTTKQTEQKIVNNIFRIKNINFD